MDPLLAIAIVFAVLVLAWAKSERLVWRRVRDASHELHRWRG